MDVRLVDTLTNGGMQRIDKDQRYNYSLERIDALFFVNETGLASFSIS